MTRWGEIKCPRCDDTFQMYVDANEARINAEAESAKLKQMWWDAGDVTDLAGTIADLEEKLRKSALQELSALGQASEAYQAQLEAEAKLAKAVGALTKIADRSSEMVWGEGGEVLEVMYDMESIAEATLAELKGQGDE